MTGQTQSAPIRIEKAARTPRKARLCWFGPTGVGKTLTALKVARGLAGGAGRIVMLDTEHRASTLYADAYTFDLVPLQAPFEPQRYVAALQAVARRYEVVIIDSASHEWAGPGGCLAQVAHLMASGHAPSRAVAWQQVVSTHHQFMQALIQCPAHLLVTLRATTAYALELTGQGTWAPQAIGLAPIQCEEFLYAFDVVGRLESVALDELPRAVRLTITSTHCQSLYGTVWDHPDEALGRRRRRPGPCAWERRQRVRWAPLRHRVSVPRGEGWTRRLAARQRSVTMDSHPDWKPLSDAWVFVIIQQGGPTDELVERLCREGWFPPESYARTSRRAERAEVGRVPARCG